jgi:ADP-heptose:LPS heptosyltransferase
MPQTLHKILVIRNDKLGDFTLSLPTFFQLKASVPACQLTALVPAYTRDIAELCPAIDQVLLDPGPTADRSAQRALLQHIRAQHFDAALTLFSTTRIGLLLWRSGIAHRFAPATKLAQVFYNHRVTQRRSHSRKPEYQYNLDLANSLLETFEFTPAVTPSAPYLKLDPAKVSNLRQQFCRQHLLDPQALMVFLHPGHGGSANNLSTEQYAALADKLHCQRPLNVIISAGPGELEHAQRVKHAITRHPSYLYESREGLSGFVYHIAFADLFISGSTGPLHVAGALDRPTCGFYPTRRSATSLRWQTLNSADRRLAFSPPPSANVDDMQDMDLTTAAHAINAMLTHLYP